MKYSVLVSLLNISCRKLSICKKKEFHLLYLGIFFILQTEGEQYMVLMKRRKIIIKYSFISRTLFLECFGGEKPLSYNRRNTVAVFALVDSSTVICWTNPFVILGVSGLFCHFYSIFDRKSC